jgi:hypothetical protein
MRAVCADPRRAIETAHRSAGRRLSVSGRATPGEKYAQVNVRYWEVRQASPGQVPSLEDLECRLSSCRSRERGEDGYVPAGRPAARGQ